MERLALGLLWLLHFLPLAALDKLGNGLGRLIYFFARERRKVALINLALCFPERPPGEREAIARAHFQCFSRVMLEQGISWWSSTPRLLDLVRVEDAQYWEALKGKPVIWLAPHFLGLDIGGVRISALAHACSVYSKQKNATLERMMLKGRSRFPSTLFARQEGLLPVVRAIKSGKPFYYLPDLDFGPKDTLFVPFFGVPAATITGLARIAQLTGARVLPAVTRQLPNGAGYELRFYPAWENYPSGDLAADTRRMNAFIEERVRETPEQYLWTHKRFKTRPPGEAKLY